MAESGRQTFQPAPEKPSFPAEEEKVLSYWDEINAFHTQLKMSEGRPEYTFYDGPPFATGTPHYGHILAGTIKDVMTRYATQNGYHVERRFGWDCHGLPIEFEINKEHGIKTKKDVLELGVREYNDLCRGIVMKYSSVWREQITRMGRWIDFDNDYKTMDKNFMESCWWAFKELYNKGLVYRSSRVMPYSNGCNTVLSNFEANMNYMDVKDPSVMITFPLLSDPTVSFVAWTTTPWTLPSNLALAVGAELDYVKIKFGEDKFLICNKDLLKKIAKDLKLQKTEVVETMKGKDLCGLEYEPLFTYFEDMKETGCFKVYPGDFVTNSEGTGIVHCAPFGVDDFALYLKFGLVNPENPPDPVDENGMFNEKAPEYQGMFIKDADKVIIKDLKDRGRLIYNQQINHSYPFCWRSNTPLIYRPVSSWFIKVESFKDQLLENNMKARWVPAFVQEKRFHNWLEDARDWCFSRNRFWGNPIPLWVSDDGEEVVCVGSVAELEELTGATGITDMHRENIDHLTIPSRMGKGDLKRVEEVFDCWYESGSMPFAQFHYPFSMNDEEFNKRFPADFIAEGLDQTRGWFYTLNILGTAVRESNPFKNLIVNGLVLAKNGEKMSKSKKNYDDPMDVVNQYGADAVRLYLMNSPLVKAEPLRFKTDGVHGTIREVFLPWFNAYRFLVQNATRYEVTTGNVFNLDASLLENSDNVMDKWMCSSINGLVKFVHNEMENYRLYTVVPRLLSFLEQLTNWYVRLNRNRLKGDLGEENWITGLNVLYEAILKVTILMAPFTPFLTEMLYQNLKNCLGEDSDLCEKSIHFLTMPRGDDKFVDEKIDAAMKHMQTVIVSARNARDRRRIPLRTPVSKVTVVHRHQEYLDSLQPLVRYIKEELNTQEIHMEIEQIENVVLSTTPDHRALGQRLGKTYNKAFKDAIAAMTHEEIVTFEQTGTTEICGVTLTAGDLNVLRKYRHVGDDFDAEGDNDVIVVLDCRLNDELINIGVTREFVNTIQKLRKTSGLNVQDQIHVVWSTESEKFKAMLTAQQESMQATLRVPISEKTGDVENTHIAGEEYTHDEDKVRYDLYWKDK